MKTKILCFLLLLCTLLLPHPEELVAHAAEDKTEPTYSNLMDEVVGMDEARLSIDYMPVLKYKYKFLWFEWGSPEELAWNIESISYYYTLRNEHKGEQLVGYNRSAMVVTFEIDYRSVDENGNYYDSSAVFTYPFNDYYNGTNYMEFVLPYEDILSGCEYYSKGYDTVLKSVRVYVSNKILNRRGSIMQFDLSCNENYATQIYTDIFYSIATDSEPVLFSDISEIFMEDEAGDGNGGPLEMCHLVVVYPGSLQETVFKWDNFIESLLFGLRDMLFEGIPFVFNFLGMVPLYLHKLVPFVPLWIISLIMFCIYFGLSLGLVSKIAKLIKSIKG